MSLYDELECRHVLPDGWDCTGHVFQTKDTPEQYLERYILQENGTLVHFPCPGLVEAREAETAQETHALASDFEGNLTFYTSNSCGWGPWGEMTEDDQPPWWAEYTAHFVQGRLVSLTGHKRLNPIRLPHVTRAEWHRLHQEWGRKVDAARGRG